MPARPLVLQKEAEFQTETSDHTYTVSRAECKLYYGCFCCFCLLPLLSASTAA